MEIASSQRRRPAGGPCAWVLLALVAVGACSEGRSGSEPGSEVPATSVTMAADTVYLGRHVITMDPQRPEASAVAVRDGRIVWVGDRADWNGSAEQTVELGERALLPGFIDAHGHLSFLARTVNLANVAVPPVGAVTDLGSLGEVLRAHIAERGIDPGDWVLGMGYDDSLMEEQRHPNRDDLDAVSTDHPLALIHVSGHLMAANSLALERAGIDADSVDPPGGVIRRRAGSREPDGVLEETATAALQRFFIDGEGLPVADIERALALYASYGITTVQDGAASWDIYRLLADAAAGDGLSLDVVIYPRAMEADFAVPEDVEPGVYRDRLKIGGVKLILDGSPQGKTAYLSHPYHVPPAGLAADYRGYPTLPQEAVDQLVARYLDDGLPMIVHCNGDAAAQMLIDAVARAPADAAKGDHRTVMIHAQTVREDQLDRMQTLGILPSYFSAHTFYWGDWHRDSVLGPERAARISPTATTLARGMHFTVHNDAPIVPPDMVRLLWATTNRETRSGATLGKDQRISTFDALRAITLDAAYQQFEEHEKGSLTAGKRADLVILSADPLAMEPAQLLDLDIVATVSRGQEVYRAPGVAL
ncbi:MAG: amidohydrolase family protein [Pseudomonadales bacterium]